MKYCPIIFPAAVLLLATACQQQPQQSQQPTTTQLTVSQPAQTPVQRGEYLVTIGGCNDCHTPKKLGPNGPEPDLSKALSGNPSTEKLAPVPKGLIAPDKYLTVVNNHLGAWVGPWGVSFAMNLTPDKETGLGSWTEQMFVSALRTGKHQGTGRPILPPMPWNWYRNMTDDDLKAVFAYLQSIPPIHNPIPDPLTPEEIPR